MCNKKSERGMGGNVKKKGLKRYGMSAKVEVNASHITSVCLHARRGLHHGESAYSGFSSYPANCGQIHEASMHGTGAFQISFYTTNARSMVLDQEVEPN